MHKTVTGWQGAFGRLASWSVVAAFLCGALAARAAETDYVAAAEKEGSVVLYGDLTTLPALATAFQAKYPKIKVVTATGDAWVMLTRFLNEKNSGRAVLDAFFLAEDVVTTADNGGHLAVFKPDSAKNFPASSLPSAKGTYTLGSTGVMMLGWNADAIGKHTLPKDWLDFATPPKDWDGITPVSNPSSSSSTFAVFAALYQNLGPAKAGTILQGLKQANAEPTASVGVQNTKVQTGERPLAFFLNSATISTLRAQGTPLEYRIPTSGAIAQSNAVAIAANAPHPNAAKLFVEYSLSEDAQKLLVSRNLYPARQGLPPPTGMPPFDQIKFMPFDLAKALKEREQILSWWQTQTGFGPK